MRVPTYATYLNMTNATIANKIWSIFTAFSPLPVLRLRTIPATA